MLLPFKGDQITYNQPVCFLRYRLFIFLHALKSALLSSSFQCCVPEPKTYMIWKLWTSVLWSSSKAVQFPLCSNSAFLSCLGKSVCQFILLFLSAKHIYTVLMLLNIKHRENPWTIRRPVRKTAQALAVIPKHTLLFAIKWESKSTELWFYRGQSSQIIRHW